MNNLRILSLLPAATEIVYLLGLEKYLVGVSHECDYPPAVKGKPKVTTSLVSNAMSSKEIDNRVKKIGHKGSGVFHIKKGILEKLRPNIILTQELCSVCAITPPVILRTESEGSNNHILRYAQNDKLKIISLEPESVGDILENILLVGEAARKMLEARLLVASLKKRLKKLESSTYYLVSPKPKVLVIEWLDPIMVAGHWVPEMIKLAGGLNLITKPGERSKYINLDQITQSKPDILIISPCGFDIDRTIKEKHLIDKIVKKLPESVKVHIIDGNAYMTRPGPRIVDGIEKLCDIIKNIHANS